MIVFYLCLTIIFLTLTILISSVSIEIKGFEIKDVSMLINIFSNLEEKKYHRIFDYIIFEISIRLMIYKLIPIKILRINSRKMKILIKRYMEKERNEKNIKEKRKRQQKKILRFKRKIEPNIKIKKANLELLIGLTNADITAIMVGILNATIAILLLKYTNNYKGKNNKKKYNKELNSSMKKVYYKIEPVYSKEFAFSLKSSLKIDLPIISII